MLLIVAASGGLKISYLILEDTSSHDANLYYYYGKELAEHNSLPKEAKFLHNIGFPIFLSGVFKTFDYPYDESILIQKVVTIVLSLVLIPLTYLFLRNWFEPKYSVIGSLLMALDPRIIQNSTFGITEPLYLVLFVTALIFVLRDNRILNYSAFVVAGTASVVRLEGLVLLPIVFIILYSRGKLKATLPAAMLFVIPLLIISLFFVSSIGKDNIMSQLTKEYTMINGVDNFLPKLSNSVLYFGWFTFPMLLFFIPFGIRHVIKERLFLLLFLIVISASTGLWAYFDAYDTRYFFHTYPFLLIITLYGMRYLFDGNRFLSKV